MLIRLSEEDATRIGCARELRFAESSITAREAVILQKATGYTLEKIGRALQGTVVRNPDGSVAYATDEDGEVIRDDKGREVPLREIDIEALIAIVWFCLRRAGVSVPFDELDFSIDGLEVGDDEDAGKG